MKPAYAILDELEALDYSKPEVFDEIPFREIVDVLGKKFSATNRHLWYDVWGRTLNTLQKDPYMTPDQKKGEVSLLFMRMLRSMLILDARKRGLMASARKPRFVYAGPKDEVTRDFCYVRAGKAYTEHQILDWQDLTWDGKIEDGGDIFTDLGGYNCRHYLVPEGYPLEE